MKKTNKRPASKKVQAIQTSRHLRVSHRKHTGHILPRRNTSYPTLVMIVLCTGVFLLSWTRFVTADPIVYPSPQSDEYVVHASVPGPAPPQAATITTPKPGTHTHTTPYTVQGSCSKDTYIEILRNGLASGVALCTATGTYSLDIDLFSGLNQLVARIHNYADVTGPDSAKVNIYYSPLGTPYTSRTSPDVYGSDSATGANVNSMTGVVPLMFKAKFHFRGFYTGKVADWPLTVDGGRAPYAVKIDWGDGKQDLISVAGPGMIDPQHTYKRHGEYHGSYVVKATISDADNNKSYLQMITIINDPPSAPADVTASTTTDGSSGGIMQGIGLMQSGDLGRLVRYIWPSYAVVVLMLLSFWLGERREYRYLKPQRHKSRHA